MNIAPKVYVALVTSLFVSEFFAIVCWTINVVEKLSRRSQRLLLVGLMCRFYETLYESPHSNRGSCGVWYLHGHTGDHRHGRCKVNLPHSTLSHLSIYSRT
jgi:hypothetical protein